MDPEAILLMIYLLFVCEIMCISGHGGEASGWCGRYDYHVDSRGDVIVGDYHGDAPDTCEAPTEIPAPQN